MAELDIEKLRAISKKFSIKVLRATMSPMNPQRWCLDLECGHEEWVTGTKAPKHAYCYTCNPVKS